MDQPPPPPIARPAAEPYPADLYQAVHTGNDGDIEFYRACCTGARDVLEFGCGWGRIAGALAADGKRVTGIDLAEDLLRRARASYPQVEFVQGDMRAVDLGQRFDRVLIPYNGLYCLLDEDDVIATFRRARAHLRDDGLLVFDAYAADTFHSESEPDADWDEAAFVKTVCALGRTWDVYERSRWVREQQRIEAVYTHVARDDDAAITSAIPQRYLLREQLPRLLREAGLSLVELHGGFHGEPLESASPLLVVKARRAPSA